MRITESRLRRIIRSVIIESDLPSTNTEELRNTYRYRDLSNLEPGSKYRSREQTMKDSYSDLYSRKIDDKSYDENDKYYEDPVFSEFSEEEVSSMLGDEGEYFKNLVRLVNLDIDFYIGNDDYIELGNDGISIRIKDDVRSHIDQRKLNVLEQRINKIASNHFSLHGHTRPSSELVSMICSEISNLRKGLKNKSSLKTINKNDIENF